MDVCIWFLLQEYLGKILILLSHASLKVFYSSLELTKCFIAVETALWLNKGL